MFFGDNRNDCYLESWTARLSNQSKNSSGSYRASFDRSNGQQSQSSTFDYFSHPGHIIHQIPALSEPCVERNSSYYRSRKHCRYDGQHFDHRSCNRGEQSRGLHYDDRRNESESFRKRNILYHDRDLNKKRKRFAESDKRNAEYPVETYVIISDNEEKNTFTGQIKSKQIII